MFKQTPKRRVLFLRRLAPVVLAIFGVFSLLLIGLSSPSRAYATAADTVNFQARLQTASGAIVPDGNYNVEFKLYSASSGGTALWTEDYLNSNSQGIQTVDGYVTADLGSITAFPNTIDWSQQLYLTMNIGGTGTTVQPTSVSSTGWDGEMNPRLTLTATPYAFQAQQAAQAGELSTIDGSNTSTLAIQGSTHGDQTFEIQDQGAAGTYDLLTTAQANNSYVQLQSGSPVQQSGQIDTSGSVAAGSILTNSLDTASSGTINIGDTNATAIALGNTSGSIATTINGTALVKSTSGNNSTIAFQVQDSSGNDLLDVDTQNDIINLGNTSTTGPSSTINIGNSTASGSSQTVNLGSGMNASATTIQGGTGDLTLETGATTSGDSGSIFIQSGVASSGTSGNVVIDTGASSAATGSYLEHDTFEDGTPDSGMDYWGGGYDYTGEAQSGTYGEASAKSLTFTTNSEYWDINSSYPGPAVTPYSLYYVSLWIRGTSAGTVTLAANWIDNDPTATTVDQITSATTSGWTQLSGYVTAPAGATNVWLSLAGTTSSGDVVYIDNAVIQGGSASPYVGIGSSNAAAVVVGNTNEAGGTLIQGGADGVDIVTSSGNDINVGTDQTSVITIGDSDGTDPLTLQGEGITQTITGAGSNPSDTVQSTTDSTNAFQVKNSGGNDIFNVDTTDQQVSADQNSSSTTTPIMSLIQNGSSSSTLALQNNTTSSAFYLSDNASNSNALTINSYGSATTITATPTFVQQASTATATSGTTQTLAFTSNNTAGNTIVAAASWQYTGITPTCSDSQNNTYSIMVTETDATNDSQSGICYASNIKAGADTVTVTYGTSAAPLSVEYRSLAIHEYSGIATANPMDTYTANAATSTANTSTATATANSGDLIFGFFTDETGSGTSATATGGFYQRTDNTTLGSPVTTEDMVQISAGSIAATQTEGAAHEYVGMMMAFKPGTLTTGSLTNTNSNALFAISQSGQTTLKNSTDSTSAFQIQNASSAPVFNVNTTRGGSVEITNNVTTVSPAITSQTSGWEWNNNANSLSTLSVSPHAIGDLMMFVYDNGGTGNVPTSVSGGDVSSWHFVENAANQDQYIYEGTITSTGTNNIVITYSGGSPTGWGQMVAQEFSSAYGTNTAWNVVAAGTDYGTTTSVPFPSLTTTQAGQLYWGYAGISGELQTSPSGCPTGYSCVSTTANDFTIYNSTATAANMSYAPTATQTSTAGSELGVIMSATPISGLALSVSGVSMVAANSTAAFQVQNSSGGNLLTTDTVNNAIVLGPDNTPTNVTVRGGAASGTNASGANITFEASDGTGGAGSGSFVFQTAAPATTYAAIGVDNNATTSTSTTSNSISYTTDAAGTETNRLMVVQAESGCGNTVTSMSYGGAPLTQLSTGNTPTVDDTSSCGHAEIWYLLNPANGTATLTDTTLGTYSTIGVTTFYNVNQTTPFGTETTATGSTTGTQATSLSVTAANSGQIVYDAIATDFSNDGVSSPGSGQSELWANDYTGGLYDGAASYKQGTSGTVTMSWDVNQSDWLDMGVPINSSLTLASSSAADTLTDSLLINNAGYVGIDNDNPQYSLDVSGSARVESIANSTTALQIQNTSGANVFSVDTSDGYVNIGTGSTGESAAKLLVLDSETGGGAEPAEVNGGMYYNATLGAFRCGEGGIWVSCVSLNNASTSSQTLTTTTTGYITGSAIHIPPSGLHAGTQFIWRIAMTKTASGTATPNVYVKYGTNGTTADASELTLTGPTETANTDTGFWEVMVTVQSVSSTGTIVGSLSLTHTSASTSSPYQPEGFATVGSFATTGTSSTFNDTTSGAIIGLAMEANTNNTFTVTQVQTQTADL